MRDRKEKIAISIDPLILKKINEKAEQEGRSRSKYIEFVMRLEVELKPTPRPLSK